MLETEIRETIKWFNDESHKICAKLDEGQGKSRKLDGGNAPYRELHKEFARRMKALKEKFGNA